MILSSLSSCELRPWVLLPSSEYIAQVCQGASYSDPGVTVLDDIDQTLSANSVVVGGWDMSTESLGKFTITYDVSDTSGNAAVTKSRFVRVIADGCSQSGADVQSPVIESASGTALDFVTQGFPYVDPGWLHSCI